MKTTILHILMLISLPTFAQDEFLPDSFKILEDFPPKALKKSSRAPSGSTSSEGGIFSSGLVNLPTPDVAGLLKAGNVQFSFYTGSINVSIPLYTVQSTQFEPTH